MSLSSVLSKIATDPFYAEFWAGAQVRTTRPVQQFLAPFVDVPDVVFHYKYRSKDSRLIEHDFTRTPGDDAVEIGLALNNGTVNCKPQAANLTLDNIFENNAEYLVKSGITTLTDIAAEDIERKAIRAAIVAAGSGTSVSFSQSTDDPIATIDDAIAALFLSGQSQEIGVIFGVNAWKLFKRNANVRAGSKGALNYETNPSLFLGDSPYMTSTAYSDKATLGVAANVQFVFPTSSVLIFTRATELSQNDPSALKTFRVDPELILKNTEKPPVSAVLMKDGRRVKVVSDWSGTPTVTNEAGFTLLNVS